MVLFKLPLFKVKNVVAHRVGGKLVLGGFDPFGQRTKYPRAKPNKAMALIGSLFSWRQPAGSPLHRIVRQKIHSQLARNSKSAYLYNQVEFALITNLLLKFFLSHYNQNGCLALKIGAV